MKKKILEMRLRKKLKKMGISAKVKIGKIPEDTGRFLKKERISPATMELYQSIDDNLLNIERIPMEAAGNDENEVRKAFCTAAGLLGCKYVVGMQEIKKEKFFIKERKLYMAFGIRE